MHKLILLLLTVTFSLFTFSAGHETPSGNEGAFTTLMVAAPNVDRYVDFLKADTSSFKTIGSTGSGVCVTNSGNEYPGQMMVWSAFPRPE